MLLRQVGEQHLAHECWALGFTDHQNAVDDQGTIDFLVHEFEVELVGNRQTQQVGDGSALPDSSFEAQGARIVPDAETVFGESEMVIKVK